MSASGKKPRGRPSVYSKETADLICLRMENGETLRQICRDDDMPSAPTVCRWVVENRDGFSERYARARDGLLDHWAEEVVSIADDGTNDWMTRETKSGRVEKRFDNEHALRSKLRVETRKWLLSRLKPEKYGDRVEVHTHKHADVTPEPAEVTDQKKDSWLDQHGNGKGPTLQ